MVKVFESPVDTLEEEDMVVSNQIIVFKYENEDEADDFMMLAHREQLSELGLKEEATPEGEHGNLHRYSIEPNDSFVVVYAVNYKY